MDFEFIIAGLMDDINRRVALGANARDIIIVLSREAYLSMRNRYMAEHSFPIDADMDGTIKIGQLHGFDIYVIDQPVTSDSANCMFVAYRGGAIDERFLSNGDYVLWGNSLYITHLNNNDARETYYGVFLESGLTVSETGTMADLRNTRGKVLRSAEFGQSGSAKEQEMQDSPELDAFLQTFKSAT